MYDRGDDTTPSELTTRELKIIAMELAIQLPPVGTDALAVLTYMRDIVERFLLPIE